jgi:hypothetical protein
VGVEGATMRFDSFTISIFVILTTVLVQRHRMGWRLWVERKFLGWNGMGCVLSYETA